MNALKPDLSFFKELLHTSLKATNACLIIWDAEIERYVYIANSEYLFHMSEDELLKEIDQYKHLSAEEYLFKVSSYFTHPDDWGIKNISFQQALKGQETSYEARMHSSVTDYAWRMVKLYPWLKEEKVRYVIALCYDINDLKIAQRKIAKINGIDSFTGGFNKTHFFEKVREYLQKNQTGQHAFVLIDIDDFKLVNDSFGHARGDQVLLSVARTLLGLAERKQGYFGRFGGDEFLIFLPNYNTDAELKGILEHLTSFRVDEVRITASVGVSRYGIDAQTAEELFLLADAAVYHAKDSGKAQYRFSQEAGFEVKKRETPAREIWV